MNEETPTEQAKILIVDDEPEILEVFSQLFRNHNYNPVIARSGIEGLKILTSQKIDAVISDINMPFMDGVELTRRIRGTKGVQSTPVILVTGRQSEEEGVLKEIGCNGFFSKPYRFKDVLAKIESLLKRPG